MLRHVAKYLLFTLAKSINGCLRYENHLSADVFHGCETGQKLFAVEQTQHRLARSTDWRGFAQTSPRPPESCGVTPSRSPRQTVRSRQYRSQRRSYNSLK